MPVGDQHLGSDQPAWHRDRFGTVTVGAWRRPSGPRLGPDRIGPGSGARRGGDKPGGEGPAGSSRVPHARVRTRLNLKPEAARAVL